MRQPIVRFLSLIAFGAACLAAGRATRGAEPSATEVAVRLAQEMAATASRLDVKSLEKLIPQTDRVVYVSNGNPITGRRYGEILGKFYATLATLDLKWDKWEVVPLSENAAAFTGWANIRTTDHAGRVERAKAIFTMVFARDATGWKRVIAQKWQSEVPSVRAVHAGATAVIPAGDPIAVRFSEAVNATSSSFRLQCPAGKPLSFTLTPDESGDGSSFLLHPETRLPAGATCRLTVLASQVTDSHFMQPMAADYSASFSVAPGPA